MLHLRQKYPLHFSNERNWMKKTNLIRYYFKYLIAGPHAIGNFDTNEITGYRLLYRFILHFHRFDNIDKISSVAGKFDAVTHNNSPSITFTAATEGFEKNFITSPIFFSAITVPPFFDIWGGINFAEEYKKFGFACQSN